MNGASPVTQNINPPRSQSARVFCKLSGGLFFVGFVPLSYRKMGPPLLPYSLSFADLVRYRSYVRRWNAHPRCLRNLGCRRSRFVRTELEPQYFLYFYWHLGWPVPGPEIRNRQAFYHLFPRYVFRTK